MVFLDFAVLAFAIFDVFFAAAFFAAAFPLSLCMGTSYRLLLAF